MLAYEANMDRTKAAAPTTTTETSAPPAVSRKRRRSGLPKGVVRHGKKFRIRWLDHAGRRDSEVFNTAKQAETALRKKLNDVIR